MDKIIIEGAVESIPENITDQQAAAGHQYQDHRVHQDPGPERALLLQVYEQPIQGF